MTVAALLDVGAAAGANVGSGANAGGASGAVSGAGGGSGEGARGPNALKAGLGFRARAGASGESSGGTGASGARAGSALIAASAKQGAKSFGIASNSPNQFVASNGNFRAQWEFAVREQSRGTETQAQEKNADLVEIADGVDAQNIQENAAETSLSMPKMGMTNAVAVNAAGRSPASTQYEAITLTAQESAKQIELVAATPAQESKTRDGDAAKGAEHNSRKKIAGAQAEAGDPAMLAMAALQPTPMSAAIQQPAPIWQPAAMIPAPEPALPTRAMELVREMPSGSGGGLPVAALHVTAKYFPPPSDSAEASLSAASHAAVTDFALSTGFAEASRVSPLHVAAADSALLKDSVETAANASSGGTRAATETSTAQQSAPELSAAGSASNPAMSEPAYASSQSSAAVLPNAPIAGMQSGIRGTARAQGNKALAAEATMNSVIASSGEGSKLEANEIGATAGRQKSAGSMSVGSRSASAAIMHSAQAVNPAGDQSGLIRVTASGEGSEMVTGSHTTASGSVAGQAPVGSAGGTFAALDAGTSVGTPGWIHASSQRAEAGFEDPELGWVGVRADVVSGTVHAAILPGSADAATALSTQLAGLGAYLSEQHTPVSAVTVATPAQQGIEAGFGQNPQQSAQQNGGEDNRGAREALLQTGRTATLDTASWNGPPDISGMVPMDSLGGMRGANISVMV